ncbi:acetyl-CoA synthetase-like protein [Xylariaceae sp. FL0804]|nr:acetyl-CoA synthetase-like protein [Xylariaceae sp. FL0804]
MPQRREPKLLPVAIDEIAAQEPDSLYGKYPIDPSDYDAGFASVTYGQLANAINGVGHWLESKLGREDPGRIPAIAYIGPNDFRYVFAFVGAIKAGFKLFLTSPRNSLAAHLALFESLDCATLIVAGDIPRFVDEILDQRPMQLLRMDETEHLMSKAAPPYPYTRPSEEAKNDIAFVCHTSGTTGIPKPCNYTHEFILRTGRVCALAPPKGYTSLQALIRKNNGILQLPLFHPGGVQLGILNAVYNPPPSIESLVVMTRIVEADWAMTAPFTLESLAKDETLLTPLASRLKLIVFAGGALPKALGDIIARQVRLVSYLGSGETAGFPIIYPDDFDVVKDWEYMGIHPKAGPVFEPQTEDTFELTIQKSVSTEPFQAVFQRYPAQDKFRTGDLFARHPSRDDMWAHASRADDIIVFLNGEKTNPVSFENHLCKHPRIEGALVFGNQRFEAGVLIELKGDESSSTQDRSSQIQELEPIIGEANRDTPAHARIAASHVLFTEAGKPFLRTPKGTVMRKATLRLYEGAIDALYRAVEQDTAGLPESFDGRVELGDLEKLVAVIQQACKESTSLGEVGRHDDLLVLGADSLQILRLCRNLRSKVAFEHFKPITIYMNPTPFGLADAIHNAASSLIAEAAEEEEKRQVRLEGTLQAFKRRIDELAQVQTPTTSEWQGAVQPHTCIVTGTTGSTGSYILRALMDNPRVGDIYCLNRGPDSAARQRDNNTRTDPELPTQFPKSVHFVEADLAQKTLGLSPELLGTLSASATLIVHNAWAVDFNLPLSSFTQHLAGVENLCRFSAQGRRRPAVMFLSSVSAVMDLALRPDAVVPEDILDDLSAPAPVGYGESKYLAERILEHAAERLHIPVAVVRIGQVCGAKRSSGLWNPKEWLPRLVMGSAALGALPESLGRYDSGTLDVDWLPVDVLADAVVELLLDDGLPASRADQPARPLTYHLMNPKRTGWAALLPAFVEALNEIRAASAPHSGGEPAPIAVVSPLEWINKLRAAVNDHCAPGHTQRSLEEENPALQLVDFYEAKFAEESFPRWEMGNALERARVLREAEEVTPRDAKRWIRLWLGGERS